MWVRTQPLPELQRQKSWGRHAIIDAFYPQRSPRWKRIDEQDIDRMRAMGLDGDGQFALGENFGSGDCQTFARSAASAVREGGALGVMTLPLTDPGPESSCPFVANPYGWSPAMAVLDYSLATPESVRLINERGRAMRRETERPEHKNSFVGIDLRTFKLAALAQEYETIRQHGHPDAQDLQRYIDAPGEEILDYAVTTYLNEHFGCRGWQQWPEEFKVRTAKEIIETHPDVRAGIAPLLYTQWKLDRQVTEYCDAVLDAGGYPIVVRPFSCLETQSAVRLDWLRQQQGKNGAFLLNPDGTAMYEAGVNTGLLGKVEKYGRQRWSSAAYSGHPEAVQFVVDSIRPIVRASGGRGAVMLDHWLGLFWQRCQFKVDDKHDNGTYVPAWGDELIDALRREFPDVLILGEDVGFDDPSIDAARRRAGTPGVDAPYFATQDGQGINWAHIDPARVPLDKVVMVGADHNAEPARAWFDALPTDQRNDLGRHFFDGKWHHGRAFSFWEYAAKVASCRQGLVTIASRDMLDDSRRDNVPGVPDSPENRLWQLTSEKKDSEERAVHAGPLADVLRETRRHCRATMEGLPLVLSMNPQAGEVVRVRPGGEVTLRLGMTAVPPSGVRIVFESTAGHREGSFGEAPATLDFASYPQDGIVVCSATIRISESVPPGTYQLWGRVEGDARMRQDLCDRDQNLIIDVTPPAQPTGR